MKEKPTYPPKFKDSKFDCPYCDALAHQTWDNPIKISGEEKTLNSEELLLSHCGHCSRKAIWVSKRWLEFAPMGELAGHHEDDFLVYPKHESSHPLSKDAGEVVCALYDEAVSVSKISPRASAALARAAIEALCTKFTPKEKHNNFRGMIEHIKDNHDFDELIINSMDAVRLIGNHAVHPRIIDLNDETNPEDIFLLVQYIVEKLILRDKKINIITEKISKKDQKRKTTKENP